MAYYLAKTLSVASMGAIDNPALKQAAAQIKAKLEGVIAQV